MDLTEIDPVTCTGLVRLKVEQVAVEGSCSSLFGFFFLATCKLLRQNYECVFP